MTVPAPGTPTPVQGVTSIGFVGGQVEEPVVTLGKPPLSRAPALKLLSWFLAESVAANARLDAHRALVLARRGATLKLLPVVADANDRGLVKPGPSGAAWARLAEIDVDHGSSDLDSLLAKFAEALGAWEGALRLDRQDDLCRWLAGVGDPAEAAARIQHRMQNLVAAQKPIPGPLWVAAVELRTRFMVERQRLNAINIDIDTVLSALAEAGVPQHLPTDKVDLLQVPRTELQLGYSLRRWANDPVAPPLPFPYRAVDDPVAGIVLEERKLSAAETADADLALRWMETHRPYRQRLTTYLQERADWAPTSLNDPADPPRVGMVVSAGTDDLLVCHRWVATDPMALREMMITIAVERDGNGFVEADSLMSATNRLIWGIAKTFHYGGTLHSQRDFCDEFREHLEKGFSEHRVPIRLASRRGTVDSADARPVGLVSINAALNPTDLRR